MTPADLVSIVIPTLNRSDLLEKCLVSLHQHAPGVEVNILQDTSPPRGFAKQCNTGAAQTHLPFVLFLNDDTEVHEGFLEPLVRVLSERSVAAVGSKLVYPDGRIQHAGVGIRETGSRVDGFHYQTDRYAGVVSAVTAACMLVRRFCFDKVGGFDEGFKNGNEDVDLCLKFNDAGWGCWYEPSSVVTHHESASGAERWAYVGENVRRLSEKWSGHIPRLINRDPGSAA